MVIFLLPRRTSHAVGVIGRKLYCFAGELQPRVPLDNSLYVLDLDSLQWGVVVAVEGEAPPPRIGITMASVGSVVYVFGGRDGEHRELNQFYSFDTVACKWTFVSEEESSPPHRSYHAMAADEKAVYIFGGCGKAGRLKDLWQFNIEEAKWKALPAGPDTLVPKGGQAWQLQTIKSGLFLVLVESMNCLTSTAMISAQAHGS